VDEKVIRTLNAQRNAFNQEIGRRGNQEKDFREKIARLEDGRERVLVMIKRKEGRDSIQTSLQAQYGLAVNASQAFDSVLSRLVEVRRGAIENYATEIFRTLTNKPGEYERLEIDEGYNVSVVDVQENKIARETLSTGEREVVALSFIFGLMKASDKVAPLILDTFFVHLDEAHYSNLVRALPSFASQIVLILTNLEYRNLRERAGNDFIDRVAQVVQVMRDTDAKCSTLRGVDWGQ
jgi:DNA sulfur modification protein DndD